MKIFEIHTAIGWETTTYFDYQQDQFMQMWYQKRKSKQIPVN